jgi:hypothetical protein
VVETTRRLLLTAVVSVCAPGSSEQAVYAVLLALLYIKLYGFYAPYDDDSDVSGWMIVAVKIGWWLFDELFCSRSYYST